MRWTAQLDSGKIVSFDMTGKNDIEELRLIVAEGVERWIDTETWIEQQLIGTTAG